MMINFWWIIPVFAAGIIVGFFMAALMAANGKDE